MENRDLEVKNQQYLMFLIHLETLKTSTILVPERILLGNILSKLSSKYLMLDFQIINNVKSYEQLLKEIREENIPKGMEFGDNPDND